MARDFQKAERRLKKDEKYKLLSYATSSESVEMTDGTDLQTKMNSVDKSISDEVTRAKGAESTLTTNLNSEISRATTKENEIASNLSSHTGNKSNPHSVTKEQVGLGNVENKSSATIRGEITKSNVTTALGYTPYTPNEVDNKLSALETNIDWKEAVATYNDIATTYPNPEDGWTVNVKDTDYTYRYNGSSWVAISANAIPKATNSVDGLLSKEDHANYEDANSKKHTHSNKSIIDKITQSLLDAWDSAVTHISDTVKHITSGERTNWNTAYTHSQSAHAPSNAQANQNAFSNVSVGSTTIAADTTTDTLTLTGSNVTLTPDANNDKVIIGITKDNVISALGYTPGSASVATSSNLGLVKSGTDITVDSSGNVSVNDDSHNHIISNVDGLQSALDGKASSSHTHSYLPLSGGTMTGNLINNNFLQTPYLTGESTGDAWQKKKAHAIQLGMPTRDYLNFYEYGGVFNFYKTKDVWEKESGDGTLCGKITTNGWEGNVVGNASTATKLATARTISLTGSVTGSGTFDGSGNLSISTTTNHTHNYAGSSSAGGSATSAVKLDSSAGSATQPVYFSSGKPVACSYTLAKSVPSNAVFTDTNTWRDVTTSLSSTSTTTSLAASAGKSLQDQITTLNSNLVKHTTMSVNCTATVSNRSPFTYSGTSSQINGTILSVTPIVSNGNWTVVPNITANKNSFYLFANGAGAITCNVIYV